jgi:hypothetical protein
LLRIGPASVLLGLEDVQRLADRREREHAGSCRDADAGTGAEEAHPEEHYPPFHRHRVSPVHTVHHSRHEAWGSVHAASALYYHRKPYKINLPKGDSLEGQYKRSCVFAPLRSYGKALESVPVSEQEKIPTKNEEGHFR